MNKYIDFLLLSRSSKNQGLCVAGINCETGQLCRLVSSDEQSDGAISERMLELKDGTRAQKGDILSVEILKEVPDGAQSENLLIDESKKWEKIQNINKYDRNKYISKIADKYNPIFGNLTQYLTENEITLMDHSLELCKIYNVNIYTNAHNKAKISFIYQNKQYSEVSMTDPCFYNLQNENYDRALALFSIPHSPIVIERTSEKRYYKFAASIILPKNKS